MKNIFIKDRKYLILFSLFLLSILSCENAETIKTKTQSHNKKIEEQTTEQIKYNLVYTKYKLPLPLELFNFLEKYSQFNEEYLNSTKDIEKYFTEIEKAIILGIYTTDFAYCNIFANSNLSVVYFETSKLIANSINIEVGYNQNFVERIEANNNNKDSLVLIADESYWKACNHLEETGQKNILPFVVFGTWIEGVYIISQSKESVPETRIKEHVFNKKEGLENIINYLYDVQIETSAFYYNDDLKKIIKKLEILLSLYEKYELQNSNENYSEIEKEITKIRNFAIQL